MRDAGFPFGYARSRAARITPQPPAVHYTAKQTRLSAAAWANDTLSSVHHQNGATTRWNSRREHETSTAAAAAAAATCSTSDLGIYPDVRPSLPRSHVSISFVAPHAPAGCRKFRARRDHAAGPESPDAVVAHGSPAVAALAAVVPGSRGRVRVRARLNGGPLHVYPAQGAPARKESPKKRNGGNEC